jgi:hypothetical protein
MYADTGLLAVVGSVRMMLALVLAWCPAGVRSRFVKKCFPNPQHLLKAHLDFLMGPASCSSSVCSLSLRLTPPTAMVRGDESVLWAIFGFLALAVRPELPQKPATPFGALRGSVSAPRSRPCG